MIDAHVPAERKLISDYTQTGVSIPMKPCLYGLWCLKNSSQVLKHPSPRVEVHNPVF